MLKRRTPGSFLVFCALLITPRVVLAAPPVALGTLEVHGTAEAASAAVVMRNPPVVPSPELAQLPPAARARYLEQQQATRERALMLSEMRAHDVSPATMGPTLRDVIAREDTARRRLRRALEASTATLTAEGWLLLAEVRLYEANERFVNGLAERTPASLELARAAYTQAAARGGTSATGLWARLVESGLAMEVGEYARAQSGLAVVIANAPPGTLRASALVQQADLDGGPTAPALYARALREGADAPLRAYVRFATMLANRFSDPSTALDAGVLILRESDDRTAEMATPIVGELLIRVGDAGGLSLPHTLDAQRAARALGAAADAALAAGERSWARLALQTATDRAPTSASGRAALTRLAALGTEAPPRETVSEWLVRQATRCQNDVLSAETPDVHGELDIQVRRQRGGVVRVIARVRPGAGAGVVRFKRCIEGVLPDPPALDSATSYRGALRVR